MAFPRAVRFLDGSLESRIFRVGVDSESIASVGGEERLVADMVSVSGELLGRGKVG